MAFGEIFITLLVILTLYYAVTVSMDLFLKPQLQDVDTYKEETEIDISDEVRNFRTIEVERDNEPTKKTPSDKTQTGQRKIHPIMTNGISVEALVAQIRNITGTDDIELEGLGRIVAKCEKAA